MIDIGLQLYSIRDAIQKDILASLEKAAQMGYTKVQFAGFSGEEAETIKKKLSELDLKIAGAHVQENLFEGNIDKL